MDFASCLKVLTRSSELIGGFLVLGCFLPAFNVFVLFLMFGLGLKLLQFTWQGKGLIQFLCEIIGKSVDKNCGFCFRRGFDKVCDSKMMSFSFSSLKLLKNSKSGNEDDFLVSKELSKPNGVAVDDDDDSERECDDNDESKFCVEDEVFDVIALRRMVKIERHRADMAYAELEKERMATASAADEAMAMILRLQSEKSSIEIEANQERRLAEQKQEYDQEMIQSLQWILMKYESEMTVLEEKLKQHMESDEVDQFQASSANLSSDFDSATEDGFEDIQTNSVEEDFSLLNFQLIKDPCITMPYFVCASEDYGSQAISRNK
ncbi:protein FLOURY 1-like [Manihot esculenta]|uniref:GTD-binding domain-containing protein n=2 Tax=Manihot esculenta TaxID=3983 RepID=A0A2C9VKH2_MANES|nr:protein FLOURY 1-like [Manihot esculenta]OAY45234.1 hypothetical protein MANES_07G043300v8 [Manihot esculenta]